MNRTRAWIAAALLLTLAVGGFGIVSKERLLATGQPMLLRLAPVDPRSLMQGDYMALRFAIGEPILQALHAEGEGAPGDSPRIAVVRLEQNGEAVFVRLHRGEPLAEGERLLRFQIVNAGWPGGRVQVSTDAWFFQEGHAQRYEAARYGEFRVSGSGEALLVGMRDEQGKPMGAEGSGGQLD
ncbi:GDYXXLXY domain-containing protein [Cupriavidus sp. AU9028]|uniref:GDYXXLXY domain-containing protein n=1 Tax=Cupriavidus sp. AU9028 TaxID=2871157 RepID=UPI001C968F5E|nr:GDYXXLXY domain-containing protein [Cupriavidus sp. AU9028]MBY4898270.1 GDYXXLXY domain-containing protein [Cupriavidus sp. AU9028]